MEALGREWRLPTKVSTRQREASSSATEKTASLESTMDETTRTRRGVAVADDSSGGLGGGGNSEKQQEGLPLVFDEMSLKAVEVLCAFGDGESEAAPFSIHTMLQAG